MPDEVQPPSHYWVPDPRDDGQYANVVLKLTDPTNSWRVEAKWDECIHLLEYTAWGANGVPIESDDNVHTAPEYHHICGNLDEWIARLTALRDLAREHFAANEGARSMGSYGLTEKRDA